MTRVRQPSGTKGSLKWIQRAVNERPELLQAALGGRLGGSRITWCSPLISDEFAEYRDAAFLAQLGLAHLADELKAFWPCRGPQWDALGRTDRDDLLLVEAKAHIGEMFSPPTAAGPASLAVIDRALVGVAEHLGAEPKAPWTQCFYQYANRLAHLYFLRSHGLPAWLVLLSFTGDAEVGSPRSGEAWEAAYSVMDHVMGLRTGHRLARYVLHVHIDVAELA